MSDTSARVSWDEIEPGLRNGVITMYQVRYQDKDNSIDLRADNTSETSIVLEDLTAGARYFIQVVAFTSAGAGPTSYRQAYNTIQTSESQIKRQTPLNTIDIEHRSITLSTNLVLCHWIRTESDIRRLLVDPVGVSDTGGRFAVAW